MENETAKKTATKRNVKKKETPPKKERYRVKVDLDPKMMVSVRNGFAGTLYYRSKRTGEEFTWEEFGAEQDLELSELKNARNSSKAFFERNYFLIDDPEVIEYLNVGQYYENAFDIEDFEDLFEMDPKEIKDKVSKLSRGQKGTVKYRAKQLIADGQIDSLKVIDALESALGVQLVER